MNITFDSALLNDWRPFGVLVALFLAIAIPSGFFNS
jgi:hypothetical protein